MSHQKLQFVVLALTLTLCSAASRQWTIGCLFQPVRPSCPPVAPPDDSPVQADDVFVPAQLPSGFCCDTTQNNVTSWESSVEYLEDTIIKCKIIARTLGQCEIQYQKIFMTSGRGYTRMVSRYVTRQSECPLEAWVCCDPLKREYGGHCRTEEEIENMDEILEPAIENLGDYFG